MSFAIFLENTVISTLGKRLSCRHWSRKEKERKAAKREKRNAVGSLLKTQWTVTNKLEKALRCGSSWPIFPDSDRRSIHYPLLITKPKALWVSWIKKLMYMSRCKQRCSSSTLCERCGCGAAQRDHQPCGATGSAIRWTQCPSVQCNLLCYVSASTLTLLWVCGRSAGTFNQQGGLS